MRGVVWRLSNPGGVLWSVYYCLHYSSGIRALIASREYRAGYWGLRWRTLPAFAPAELRRGASTYAPSRRSGGKRPNWVWTAA